MRLTLSARRGLAAIAIFVAALGTLGGTAQAAPNAPPLALRIIAFNDFHGHLEPGNNTVNVPHPADPTQTVALRAGGVAHLATLVRQLRAEVPHALVVSAGDLVGGSPLVSALFRDEPTIEAMNALGLDINAVGNHEFDNGAAELRRVFEGGCAADIAPPFASCAVDRHRGAKFAVIAANVLDADGRPWLPPYAVRSFDGVRIGVIGAVTRATPRIVMPNGIIGLKFRAEVATLNRYAEELKKDGVQALIAVVHEGGETDGGANACNAPRGELFDDTPRIDPAIAVVITGHTHRAYICTLHGRVLTQAGSNGRWVTVIDAQIDRRSSAFVPGSVRARNVPVVNTAADDTRVAGAWPPLVAAADVAELVAAYRERAAPLAAKPVGRIAAPFLRQPSAGGDHAAGRLIADAQLEATRSAGARIAFTNPGGIRTDLVAPSEAGGTISYGDVFAMQPFGNALVTMTLSGRRLRELLEAQWSRTDPVRARFLQPSRGFTYAWSDQAPRGARLVAGSMRLNGTPIADADMLRVTVNSYLAEGGDGFSVLRHGRDQSGGPLDVEALADYLSRQSAQAPLAPDSQARIRRAP
jgi:5'-nucleotidase